MPGALRWSKGGGQFLMRYADAGEALALFRRQGTPTQSHISPSLQRGKEGLQQRGRMGASHHVGEQFPVSAYVGSSKNLKELKAL